MDAFDTYLTRIPAWATSLEVVAETPREGSDRIDFAVEEEALFLVVVASLPNGSRPSWLDARIDTDDLPKEVRPGADTENGFVDKDRGLIVLQRPHPGNWRFGISSTGRTPFAVNLMAFHPVGPSLSSPSQATRPWQSVRCRACKMTAKALALAIVAAAALPALPQALLAAVASFLGVGVAIAAAFIGSVIGDTADIIAEKLCRKVGLC